MIRSWLRDSEIVEQDGFRLRGMDVTRLETFTDAAFAFAVTMLAFNLDGVPKQYDELLEGLKSIPSLLASLAMLLIFWRMHEKFSRRYGLENARVVALSFAMVATVLVYIYAIKFMFTIAFGFFIPALRDADFPYGVYTTSQLSSLFILYGVGWVIFQSELLLLYTGALGKAEELELDELERYDTMTDIWVILAYIAVALVSVAVALSPLPMFAGFVYCSYAFLMPLLHWRRAIPREALLEKVRAERAALTQSADQPTGTAHPQPD